jgi:hypothetical protein
MFLPCRNVAIAAQRIVQLVDRCKAHPRLKTDPSFCAVAVYRGSWEHPDVKFAEAVSSSVAKGDAPNFDMPKGTSIEFNDIASETPPPSSEPFLGSVSAPDERERGWSSALFPPGPKAPRSESNDVPNNRPTAEEPPSSRASSTHPLTAKAPIDSLFVLRPSDRRPQ